MELSWSTFILEVINFLVLIWILKRFFYKPVLNAIARRQEAVRQDREQARQLHDNAKKLETQYRNRLDDWQREREQARETLQHEIDAERQRQLAQVKAELAAEREKSQTLAQRALDKERHAMETAALQQGMQFTSRLLERLACPELEKRLAEHLLTELQALPEERWQALRSSWITPPTAINVRSAYPLDADYQQQLQQCLLEKTALQVPVHFLQEATLLAGIEIDLGAWALQASLRDELKAFAELAHHDS